MTSSGFSSYPRFTPKLAQVLPNLPDWHTGPKAFDSLVIDPAYIAGGLVRAEAHANSKGHFESRKWLFGQLAALVTAMDAVKEDGGRSLLDNSAIFMVSNMATGGSHDVGRGLSIPMLYAGSCGGYLKTGVAIKLGARVPHNRLLHAFMSAMGVGSMGFDGGRYGSELTEVRA